MKKILYLALLLVSAFGFAQKRVETSIDTTKNKIGAQFNLTLRTNVDTLSNVTFPSGTNFGNLEVIRNYVIDTVKKGDRYELVKKYGLTQFDSGRYTVPQLKVIINDKPYFSDSLTVEVSNVVVDTLKQKLYDIKPIMEAPSVGWGIWGYLLGLVLLAAIGYGVYLLVKKLQKKKTDEIIYKSPIEKANALLSNLEKKQLVQRGEVKDYYSELTDIARTYIEEVVHIPAMESTTSELIVALRNAASNKKMPVNQETFENLERVLKTADLVKFAKSRPMDFEIVGDREKIEKVIVVIDKSVPKEEEDEETELFHELQRQKMLKRQKRNRIFAGVGVFALLLLGTFVFFVATKGFDYVKDNLIGHPTKDLLDGEWVYSEYGNPAIAIETPKVLKRDDKQRLPKDAAALIKDMQMFTYGSLTDNFYIIAGTINYKGETQIDLEKGVEGYLHAMESQGASNMLIKQEEFNTDKGISGRKAYGTMTLKSPTTGHSEKMYYELLAFGQQNGLQVLLIAHREDDEYAKQIRERVINSAELKIAAQ
ncbi:MAG: hypothetical protein EOO50_03230 [Flavobacterium sp.]|uniref:hypothetical protein n=1 Tax=Flavobacterium sp. TaxID=239 RepID=UPI001219EA24|nr:hypothetical protein [Flavobacterium sp.]RZJ68113.1 MAG: hypothetical protein EOO50_03230 [Flavobacterium sp.]